MSSLSIRSLSHPSPAVVSPVGTPAGEFIAQVIGVGSVNSEAFFGVVDLSLLMVNNLTGFERPTESFSHDSSVLRKVSALAGIRMRRIANQNVAVFVDLTTAAPRRIGFAFRKCETWPTRYAGSFKRVHDLIAGSPVRPGNITHVLAFVVHRGHFRVTFWIPRAQFGPNMSRWLVNTKSLQCGNNPHSVRFQTLCDLLQVKAIGQKRRSLVPSLVSPQLKSLHGAFIILQPKARRTA